MKNGLVWYVRERNGCCVQTRIRDFSQKSVINQFGLNTMQAIFLLESNNVNACTVEVNANGNGGTNVENQVLWKNSAATYLSGESYGLRAYSMCDKLIACNNKNGSVRAKY